MLPRIIGGKNLLVPPKKASPKIARRPKVKHEFRVHTLPQPIPQPPQPVQRNGVVVWTDGSCERNGKPDAAAGYGCYWGRSDHPFNTSAPLEGDLQTNQRAELRAIGFAIETWLNPANLISDQHLFIITDSTYSKQCLTEWAIDWEQYGWKKKGGGKLCNLDLIRPLYEDMKTYKHRITIEWVKGHSGDKGNDAADALADAGAKARQAMMTM